MNNKTKVITGISGIAIILTTLEIFHVIFSVKEASEPKPEDVFKNARVPHPPVDALQIAA